MVFVAEALGSWLVEQVADASRRKLTELILGSEQERALRQAATAAVQATAAELSPADDDTAGDDTAGQLAMVISQVFGEPVPARAPAGPATLLEALRAGIARQLAVLDDAGLTGTGRSSAGLLGTRGDVLADRLADHLVREILFRGSGGGPLTPLASQLNHDRTYLRLGQLISQSPSGPAGPAGPDGPDGPAGLGTPGALGGPAGRPLAEVTDPFALEVHRPIQAGDPRHEVPALPAYLPREHDTELATVVRAAAEGRSGIAVLVGGSSTGKTRACWEALKPLRDRPERWRLWHPIDPSRPDAARRELTAVGPRTVVWLNEAQFYLDVPDSRLGEQVAAGLRELLRDPARAPVLVLATLWPQFWDRLSVRPAEGADRHAQARALLAGQDIAVPPAFTGAQIQRLRQAGDARLVLAAGARDGQVTQFLAGAPELLARYRNAPPDAAALIRAAMDARRLGAGIGLPHAFLAEAAPGYLTGDEWDALGEDWLDGALAYTAVPGQGVRGLLTRIRPHPADRADTPDAPGTPLYRLADYLDQYGRDHRRGEVPPAGFWSAAAHHAAPADQVTLADAAHARGLYRYAAQLNKNAAARGNLHAVRYLSDPPRFLRRDAGPVRWAVAHVPLDDPAAVAGLLDTLRAAGTGEEVTVLLGRDPAAHAALDDPGAAARLLDSLHSAGADGQVTRLAERAAALAPVDDLPAVARLLDALHRAGADERVITLAERAAAQARMDDPDAVAGLLDSLRAASAQDQVTALLHRDPVAHAALDDPIAVARLLDSLREAGAADQIAALASRAASHAPLDNLRALTGLLDALHRAGSGEPATALAERAVAGIRMDDPDSVAWLLDSLRAASAQEQVTALLHRDPAAHAALDDPAAVAGLVGSLLRAGAGQQVAVLAERAAARAPLDNPRAVSRLLDNLRIAGADQQVTTLAERAADGAPADHPRALTWLLDNLRAAGAGEQLAKLAERAAARAPLDDPDAVTRLLDSLWRAGATEPAAALADRAAARAPLDDPADVAWLLDSLREAGADQQVTTLLHRDPAARADLGEPRAVATLLDSLRKAGADQQVTTLLHRDPAARADLSHPDGVTMLLGSLRAAGARDQVAVLAGRLPGAGLFELFRKHADARDRFRFGREPDGRPAPPWGWRDLE